MRHLQLLPETSEHVYEICAAKIRKPSVRALVQSKLSEIEDLCSDYRKLAADRMLHTADSDIFDTIKPIDRKVFVSLYENHFRGKPTLPGKPASPGRIYYDAIYNSIEMCAYCKVASVSQLDHVLPQDSYAVLSLELANLVPSCGDCNYKKLKSVASSIDKEPFHPYYWDRIDGVEWLTAEIAKIEGSLEISYSVGAIGDPLLESQINHNLDLFGIKVKYALQASSEFASRRKQFRDMADSGGTSLLGQHFAQTLNSCREYEKNSWRTGLYSALLDSIELWEN